MRKKIIIDNLETNYEISDDGKIFNIKTDRQLKGTCARNEYHSVQLTINGKSRSCGCNECNSCSHKVCCPKKRYL